MRIDPRQRWALTLFAVALMVRIAWVLSRTGEGLTLSDDAKAYHDLAVNLVERHQFVTVIDPPHRIDIPYATRPPLTPFVLATAYSVFGPHVLVGQMLLAAVGAFAVVAVYLLGKNLFSSGVGILAGMLATFYPFFVFLAALPLTENLALLLYTILALWLTKKDGTYTTKHAALTGCLLGLAALNRPQVLGFAPFLFLLALIEREKSWTRRTSWLGVTLACWAAVVTPWVIRDHFAVGGWPPITLQGGSVLYEGNNPYTQTALSKLEAGARGWYDDPRYGAELEGLSPLDADRMAFRLAIAFVGEHPAESLGYSVQKVKLFLSPYHHSAAQASWYPVLGLSLLGFFWSVNRWRRLLPVYLLICQTVLTAAVYTSMPRFRAPVEPFFLLMAAFALHHLWERRGVAGSNGLVGRYDTDLSARSEE